MISVLSFFAFTGNNNNLYDTIAVDDPMRCFEIGVRTFPLPFII